MNKFNYFDLNDTAFVIYKWLYESDMNYKGSYFAMLWNIWHNAMLRDEIAEHHPMEVAVIEMILKDGEENTFSLFESTKEKYKELKNA